MIESMVGAEGFEGSYTRDRYAVFFVRFDCKTTQFEGFAGFLKRTLLSRIFSPIDSFLQDFRITSYHQRGQSRGGGSLPSAPKSDSKAQKDKWVDPVALVDNPV
ncbi:hypothetical protein [Edaphobacter dinghuensis]|uniref:Uncharacterized protein n=1 Tax=Edaphobacter dinghuensis TaxID=1560005 RepID=A0A917HQV9_9BACT|nr:hypothetical protein [Edaphobacter dinghuensis]GGG87517.1 hypothetical protein GCM10011585_34520 [Edaphobacter dinghuensis]